MRSRVLQENQDHCEQMSSKNSCLLISYILGVVSCHTQELFPQLSGWMVFLQVLAQLKKVSSFSGNFFSFFFFNFYFIVERVCVQVGKSCRRRERERQTERERERETDREREFQAESTPSVDPNTGLDPTMVGSWPEPKPRVRYSTNWATQESLGNCFLPPLSHLHKAWSSIAIT